ncbi:hypothetical protein SAVCW2_41260 [Streptomyces avermitilis]|nr:hypothetical protein SAVCW2_41260 [Streptomyces avermitilis]
MPPVMVATTGPSRGSGASCVGVHFAMRTAYEAAPAVTSTPVEPLYTKGLRAEMEISFSYVHTETVGVWLLLFVRNTNRNVGETCW